MRIFRNSMVVALTVGAVYTAACSSEAPSGAPGQSAGQAGDSNRSGTISAALQLGPGITLSSVSYTITNPTLPGFTTITNSVDVSNSQGIGFTLALPAGGGYELSLSATDSNGDACAGGPASFSITAGQPTAVGLTLECTGIGEGGLIGPDVNPGTVIISVDASLGQSAPPSDCAAVSSLVAAPNRIDVGHSVTLSAAGIDPSFQSSDVTLTWVATGSAGSLAGSAGTSNVFSCTSPGSESVTVTAAISNGGASCPGTGSLTVAIECDATSDAGADTGTGTGGQDAGPDTSTVDAGVDTGTGTVDAGPDTSTADTGAAETGTGPAETGGPLVPCTTAGQTGCVGCFGSDGNVCSSTEALFVALDIASGAVKTAGPEPVDD